MNQRKVESPTFSERLAARPSENKPNDSKQNANKKGRKAFLLILVLLVVAGVSLGAMSLLETMVVSKDAAQLGNQQTQAKYIADSGIEFLRYFLAFPKNQQDEMGGWRDNPSLFQALNVIPDADPARVGNFTIISPNQDEMGQYSGIRYGLQNESARLNLNALVVIDQSYGGAAATMAALGSADADLSALGISSDVVEEATGTADLQNLGRSLLMGLPGMTEDVADAILDWIDEDDEPREFGCEIEYYSQLPTPYAPANGSIQSVEQLLLVRGVTPELLFGLDQNRNGVLDAGEMNAMGMMSPMGGMQTGAMASADGEEVSQPDPLGWAQYLTLHSAEKNVDRDGNPRVFLNQEDLELLEEELVAALGNETWATFIVAYRKAGKAGGSAIAGLMGGADAGSEESGSGAASAESLPWNSAFFDSVSGEASVTLSQVLDLVDATIEVDLNGEPTKYISPFTSEPAAMAIYMPVLMDKLTTVQGPAIPGRISVNDCPRAILMGIPSMTPEIVDAIIEARAEQSDSENRKFESWLVVEGHITIDQMRTLAPLITGGGSVYRAQIVGYFEQGPAFCRAEVIIDSSGDVPMVRMYRRMDHLGRGFSMPILGQRSGVGGVGGMGMGSNLQ
jgi:type II secretory pathway component PulK